MTSFDFDFDGIPEPRRAAFADFGRTLAQVAGDNLLGLCAFGGWIVDDRCYERAPARSVAVLKQTDLPMLDRLASQGSRFGRKGVAAPLVMTPEYIQASRDVFPLELLEIQQLHKLIVGDDHFSDLKFAPADLRLQSERELKSELIHLRQGLIAATGHHKALDEVCAAAAERTIRVLRGVLHLAGKDVPRLALDVMTSTAEVTGLKLVTLARAAVGADRLDFDGFQRCYSEVEALARHVDELDKSPSAGRAQQAD